MPFVLDVLVAGMGSSAKVLKYFLLKYFVLKYIFHVLESTYVLHIFKYMYLYLSPSQKYLYLYLDLSTFNVLERTSSTMFPEFNKVFLTYGNQLMMPQGCRLGPMWGQTH